MEPTEQSAPGTRPRRRWLPLLVVLGGTALLGSVSLVYPFGRDQGIYGFIARLVMSGRVMYRDIIMGMAPMTVVVHLLANLLFGRSMTAIRVLDLAWTGATAALVYLLAARVSGRRWFAVAAGLGYPFLYYLFRYWDTAQVDGFLNLPVVAAFALVLPAVAGPALKHRLRWFGAGALVGIAFLFKYPAAFLLAVPAGLALRSVGPGKLRRALPGIGLLAAGFALPVAVTLVWLAARGALGAFLEPITHRAFSYPAVGHLDESLLGRLGRLAVTGFSLAETKVALLFGLAGLARTVTVTAGWVRRPALPRLRFAWAWAGLALVGIYLQGRFFPYHFLPLLPPLAILGAAAVYETARLLRLGRAAAVVTGAAVATALVAATPYPARLVVLARVASGREPLAAYWHRRQHSTPDFHLAEQLALAGYLRETSGPDERLLVWGMDPLVNLLADRLPVTRFIYNHQLTAVWSWSGLREEFIKALAADPPELLVVVNRDAVPLAKGHELDSYRSLMEFPALREFVLREYEVETAIGRFDVLRRTDSELALPDLGPDPDRLRAGLREALQEVARADPAGYRSILWPWHPDSARAALRPELRDRVISYRELSALHWQQRVAFGDILPALSVWLRDDPRPFASLAPFYYQDDAGHFIADGMRFTLLGASPNRLVLLYRVEPDRPSAQR